MGTYRIARPMVVDAVQCTAAKTIATDLGFVTVKQGEWIISGEGGERYIVDDEFFRRTFVAAEQNQTGGAPREQRRAAGPVQGRALHARRMPAHLARRHPGAGLHYRTLLERVRAGRREPQDSKSIADRTGTIDHL